MSKLLNKPNKLRKYPTKITKYGANIIYIPCKNKVGKIIQ